MSSPAKRPLPLLLAAILAAVALAPLRAEAQDAAAPVGVRTTAITKLPVAVASFGAAVHDGALYVLAGHVGRAHQHSRDNLSPRFLRLAAGEDRWEELPGGVGLQSVALVATGRHLYRIGGMEARNARGEDDDLHSVSDVSRYDPATGTWHGFSPLPSGRSSHDAVVDGSRIFVVGGWTLDKEERTWRPETLVCDLSAEAPAWRALPQPFRRRALAAAAWDGRVYAIGGLTESGRPSTRVDVLDPASQTWTEGPELPSPGFGASAFATTHGLFVSLLDGRVLRLSDAGDAWDVAGRLVFPRFFHRLVQTGPDELAFIAGAGKIGHLATIERAVIEPRSDAPGLVSLRLGHPGSTKNRQAVVHVRGTLRFFGGNRSLGQHDFSADDFTDEGFRIDLATLGVSKAPRLPVRRQSLQSVVWEDRGTKEVLVLGGFGHDGEAARSHDQAFAYDLQGERFSPAGSLPRPLTQFGLTVWEDELWVFGGLDYDPRRGRKASFQHSDTVYRATLGDPEGLRFEATEWRLPEPRRAFGGARPGDRYYVAGGMTADFELVTSFLAFDLEEKRWHELPAPEPRISPELVAAGGRLYLAGGSSPRGAEGGFAPNPSVEVFDPATDSWSVAVERLPVSPKHVRMFELQGRLVIVSTHNEEGVVELVFVTPNG